MTAYDFDCDEITASGNASIDFGDGYRFENVGSITLSPLGGGADDWPTVIADAGTGKRTQLALGTFHALTDQQWPSNSLTEMLPATVVHYDVSPLGGWDAALHQAWVPGAVATTVSTTGVVGSTTLVVADSALVPAGSYVQLATAANGFPIHQFLVTVSAGTAPGALTLDAPLPFAYAVGALVRIVTGNGVNIEIDGHGALFTPNAGGAVADRVVQFATTRDCRIRGLNIDNSGSGWAASFDMGGIRNTFERLNVYGGGAIGLTLEGQRDGLIRDCHVRGLVGGTTVGLGLYSCTNSGIERSSVDGGTVGVAICAGDATDGWSTTNAVVRDCSLRNLTDAGVVVANGSHDILISGGDIVGCTIGVDMRTAFTGAAVQSHDVTVEGVTFSACGIGVAARIATTDDGNEVIGCRFSGLTGNAGLAQYGELSFTGCRVRYGNSGGTNTAFSVSAGGRLRLSDSNITFTYNLEMSVGVQVQIGTAYVDNVRIKIPNGGNAYGFYVLGASPTVLYVSNVDFSGPAGTSFITLSGATALVWMGDGCHMSAGVIPVTFAAAATQAQCNFGTSTLVAGTVSIPCVWAHAGMRVAMTPSAWAGTPNPLRVSAINDGVSFDITSDDAADTSTIQWRILDAPAV